MPSRIQIAKPDIFKLFDASKQRVYQSRDLQALLAENRNFWRLAQSTTVDEFIKFLAEKGKLRRWSLPFPHRKEIRYTWGEVPLFAILMTVKPNCHFSHYAAIRLHELTEQDPKAIYINFEQKQRVTGGDLAQDRIDAAFSRRPRITKNFVDIDGFRVWLINGRRTDYLGVESRPLPTGDGTFEIRLTDLERTLIDAAVRPFYCGGVSEVLKAYRLASPHASTNRLAALLTRLGYIYPYHQAVGFYLERSGGYSSQAVETFRDKFTFDFDFHLTYQMGETEYDSRWRIYVPRGL